MAMITANFKQKFDSYNRSKNVTSGLILMASISIAALGMAKDSCTLYAETLSEINEKFIQLTWHRLRELAIGSFAINIDEQFTEELCTELSSNEETKSYAAEIDSCKP